MRNLAEVCSIKTVETIIYKEQEYTKVKKYTLNENAYTFIAQAGFSVGDKVVFIGEGALIPASNKDFEFLRAKCYLEKLDAFRIKPSKMCGEISMGILMPMSILPKDRKVGSDVTEELNIKKYEPEEDASPKKENKFKSFMFKYLKPIAKLIWSKKDSSEEFPTWLISKTDEDNIQHKTNLLQTFAEEPAYITVKMEGQSGTFIFDGNFYCCSRNKAYLKKVDNNYWNVAEKYDLKTILTNAYKETGHHFAIQGEICGPSIQNNIYDFESLTLFVFNIKNIDTGEYMSWDCLKQFCNRYKLMPVSELVTVNHLKEFVTEDTLHEIEENFVERLSFEIEDKNGYKEIKNSLDKKIDNKKIFHHEGIVIRTCNQKFSCKFKSKQYALWFSGKEG